MTMIDQRSPWPAPNGTPLYLVPIPDLYAQDGTPRFIRPYHYRAVPIPDGWRAAGPGTIASVTGSHRNVNPAA